MNKIVRSRGAALPLVLVVVILLLTMGTGLLSVGLNGRVYSIRTTSDITARCAADAGLTKALFEMNQKIKVVPWNDSTLPLAKNISLIDCDAVYSYIVTGDLGSSYVITSIGQADNASRMVQATLGLRGIFDHAILTKDDLILKSDTVVDGYNSSDPTDKDVDVTIGSQSTDDSSVVLNNGVVVDGDVLVGRGGNPDTGIKDLGATVNGEKRAATLEEPLPRITPPLLENVGGTISAKGETITITPADSGVYEDINLQRGKDTTILEVSKGDVVLHITGNIELDNKCEIIVNEGATLTIYIDGDIQCREGSSISTEAPPEEATTIQLFATGDGAQMFDIKAKSDWTGAIYAPDAHIDLYANGDAYGSIVAHGFEFKSGGNFHYDEALRDVRIYDQGVRFTVTKWSESQINTSVLEVKERLLESLLN